MAASQISINTEVASGIYEKAKNLADSIEQQLKELDVEINKLPNEGEWRGAAADKFLSVYADLKDVLTVKTPETLHTLHDNLDTNLKNLIEADSTGAR